MQQGKIVKRSGSWYVRFNVKVADGGKTSWKSKAIRLAPDGGAYRTESSVRELADAAIRGEEGTTASKPTCVTALVDFIENDYFPWTDKNLKPSTASSYRDVFKRIKDLLTGVELRQLDSRRVQQILNAQAERKQLASSTHAKTKHFLGGVWNYAKAERGLVDGADPVDDSVRLPRGTKAKTHAYSLNEIFQILDTTEDVAINTAILVFAFTGLRKGEVAGLKWEDFDGENIQVCRNVWEGQILDSPKTDASRAPVPVVPIVAEALAELRKVSPGEFIFTGATGQPMRFDDVAERKIKPALAKEKISWHGWHAFRRGLATNLHALGTDAKTMQSILRHANAQLTLSLYTKQDPEKSRKALETLSTAFKSARKARKTA